ncbi:hypothetical protein EDD32_3301 [Georgenia muralis]|uniref:Alpha-glucosidase n=1 Tax=Georgenia muralis TaxID=154117 RepID=A0A3N4ZA14_9MICO|nr:hypothetical protein EDD32_3301 [Georgenia muralis]
MWATMGRVSPAVEPSPVRTPDAPADADAPEGADVPTDADVPGRTTDSAPPAGGPGGTGRLGDLTVTTLVHRGARGPAAWWEAAVVYQVPGRLDVAGARTLSAEISHLARLGADVLQVRVPELDPADPAAAPVVGDLVRRTHQRGLRMVVGLAGHDAPAGTTDPAAWHLARCAAWLDRGVDGIDMVVAQASSHDGPHRHEGIDLGALHALLAERSDDAVLTGAASATDAGSLLAHLQEDWLHVTRDDRLAVTDWSAEPLRSTITDSYAVRDVIGVPAGWTTTGVGPARGRRVWARTDEDTRERRLRALTLLTLALPGVAYLRQGDATGVTVRDEHPVEFSTATVARVAQEQRGELGSAFENFRLALRLRHELRLGTGHLAWVDEKDGREALILVNRSVLVVTNLGEDAVRVPADRELLHASSPLGPPVDGDVVVPRDTTVWFSLA